MEHSSGARQLFEEKISSLNSKIERAKSEIESNVKLIAECKDIFSENNAELSNCEDKLTLITKKAEELSKKLLSVSEKIELGEQLAEANRKKVIESIESLSDVKLNTGTMNIERSNLVDKLDELVAKLDNLSVKRKRTC